MNKKTFLFFTFFCFFAFFSFSQSTLSKNSLSLINAFFDLRMNLGSYDENNTDLIISKIDNFYEKNKAQITNSPEQERIIIENFIIMEKYNYLYQKPGQAKVQHEILGKQLKLIEQFLTTFDKSNLNEYFYCTQADITSCYMGFSVSDVLKYGKTVKPLYEQALKINPTFSYALSNIGQWYYFAPGIVGGSKKKALMYFELSVKNAKTPSQKYFSNIFYSQLLFENKEFEKSSASLQEAFNISPNSKYLAKIKSLNQQGTSLYEYNAKKSSLKDEQ